MKNIAKYFAIVFTIGYMFLFTLIGLHDAEIHLPFQPFVCAITPCTESKYSRMKTHSGNGFMRWSYGGSQKGGASFNPFLHTRSMTLTVLFSVGSPTPILNRPIRQKWSLNKVKSSGQVIINISPRLTISFSYLLDIHTNRLC